MIETKFSVAIVRIMGNELPPRHRPGSHLEQLKFILDNEPTDPQVKKIWLLNRIINPNLALALSKELECRQCNFASIPFNTAEYKTSSYKIRRGFLGFRRASKNTIARKAGLIIGINKARNHAMKIGQAFADWTIPLDGGCCFNEIGFHAMLKCAQQPIHPAYAIPTYRLMEYDEYSSFHMAKHPMHEAMLMLPSGKVNPFDEKRLYGNSDKLAAIKQLFPKAALRQTPYATIVQDNRYHAGYVLRLPSGNPAAEGKYKERIALRAEGLSHLVGQVESMLKNPL